jgi:hypothetical protein
MRLLLCSVPVMATLAGAASGGSIVGFERSVEPDRIASIVERAGGRVTRRIDHIRVSGGGGRWFRRRASRGWRLAWRR